MDDDAGSGDAQPLVLANVGGVFIVLAAGSGLAVVCAFIEMVIDVWITSHKEKVSYLEELKAELKFIISFTGNVKPVRHREASGSGSKGSKKEDKEDDVESHGEEDDIPIPVPTPSDRSSHTRHLSHSRRQSNATHMAKVRKSSNQK